jgi:proteasome accessory factor C
VDRFDRIYALHRILRAARLPVPRLTLQEGLECSRATVSRIIAELRDFLGAPIEYDRSRNGYFYAEAQRKNFELPGLWFSASELYALLAAHQLLKNAQPGLLDEHLAPLRRRIEKILQTERLGSGEIARRVRILHSASRRVASAHFRTVAGALMQRRRLLIRYHGRARDIVTERPVSPQRLVHYRDNWYLDAWCHCVEALRSFAVDRVEAAHTLEAPAREMSDEALDAYFASAYGIFAGRPTETAVLRFTPERARWVADERWHSAQQGRFLDDGSYELSVPYSDPRELVMDILKYGPDVEVLGPQPLRERLIESLRESLRRYGRA